MKWGLEELKQIQMGDLWNWRGGVEGGLKGGTYRHPMFRWILWGGGRNVKRTNKMLCTEMQSKCRNRCLIPYLTHSKVKQAKNESFIFIKAISYSVPQWGKFILIFLNNQENQITQSWLSLINFNAMVLVAGHLLIRALQSRRRNQSC